MHHSLFNLNRGYCSGFALCVSKDFDDLEPLDFQELFSVDEAEAKIKAAATEVAKYALKQRDQTIGEATPLDNIENVSQFLGKLAI